MSIGFIEHNLMSNAPTILRIYDLTKTLTAFQRAVYSTAANDIGRRGLTRDLRIQYTWAVTAYRPGSFWTDLIPFTAMAAQQMSMFADESRTIWTATAHTIETIHTIFSRKKQDTPFVQQSLPHIADIAKAALDSDKDTHIKYKSPSGEEITFKTTSETSKIVVARRALTRGQLCSYPGCMIQDIKTTSPDLIVTIPQYPNTSIRCTYGKGNEQHFTPMLKTYEKITVVGAPVFLQSIETQIQPDVIEIAYLENEQGDVIGQPSLPTFLQKQMQDDDNDSVA